MAGSAGAIFLFWLLWRIAGNAEKTCGTLALACSPTASSSSGGHGDARLSVAGTPDAPAADALLHLVYFFLMLIAGCLLGKYLLKTKVWRWRCSCWP